MSDQVAPRRPRERRNRDAEVLDAAVEIFFAKGYSAASVQDVADRVGVLKGSLYHYMSSKEDLLFRIFEGSHLQAMEIMEAVVARSLDPRQRLEAFIYEIVHWYVANYQRVSLYFNEWRYLTGENAKKVRDHRRSFAAFISDTLAEGEGSLRHGLDPYLATLFIIGAINHIPVWYRTSGVRSSATIAQEFATMSTTLTFAD